MLYRLVRPLVFCLDPERAHEWVLSFLSIVDRFLPAGEGSRLHDPDVVSEPLSIEMAGVRFPNPVGLAAGCDKNAVATRAFAAFGFGFLEIGTVTPKPQPGNPKPRIERLVHERSVINRMGFNSPGVESVARNLTRRTRRIPVGANIGPNRNTPPDQVVESLVETSRALAPLADYLVLNLSSPNTPGLRDLLGAGPLKDTLRAFRKGLDDLSITKPLFLKVSPDLDDTDLVRVAETAAESRIDAIIATNTTVSREGVPERYAQQGGGLSGSLLKDRSDRVLSVLYRTLGGRLPLIGVGGIEDAADAYGKIRSGASLVQIYTSLIYEGPGLVRRIVRGLAELLKRDGLTTLRDAVGLDVHQRK